MTIELPIIEYATTIPEAARAGGRSATGENPILKFMQSMPVPAAAKKGQPVQYASFFVAASLPADTITDADERAKALKANVNKLVNKYTSLARRINKTDPTANFLFRKARANEADPNSAVGLRIFRGEPKMPSPSPAPAAAAA